MSKGDRTGAYLLAWNRPGGLGGHQDRMKGGEDGAVGESPVLRFAIWMVGGSSPIGAIFLVFTLFSLYRDFLSPSLRSLPIVYSPSLGISFYG